MKQLLRETKIALKSFFGNTALLFIAGAVCLVVLAGGRFTSTELTYNAHLIELLFLSLGSAFIVLGALVEMKQLKREKQSIILSLPYILASLAILGAYCIYCLDFIV